MQTNKLAKENVESVLLDSDSKLNASELLFTPQNLLWECTLDCFSQTLL